MIHVEPLRIEYDGAVYHVTSRGNERKAIYKDDKDREIFLEILHKANKRYNWLCHAYCLMNNHYHIVIETPDGNLARGMRQLNGVYTQTYNVRHNRVGHIFQGRYKAILLQKDSHLLEVSRYVVLNPVRAKAVQRPQQWKWSSYLATAGEEAPQSCLTTEWILSQFGQRKKQAEGRYKEFISEGIGNRGIWNEVKCQSILGEEKFAEELSGYIRGTREIKEIPRMQRYIDRPELNELFKDREKRSKAVIYGRAREAVEKYGYSQRDVAKSLGVHYSTISKMLKNKTG